MESVIYQGFLQFLQQLILVRIYSLNLSLPRFLLSRIAVSKLDIFHRA
jgi:hypothetical protein